MSKTLLPSVPAHLLSLIVRKAQQANDEDSNLQEVIPTIDLLPLPVEPIGYGFFNYAKQDHQDESLNTTGDETGTGGTSSTAAHGSTLSARDFTGDNHYLVLGFPANINAKEITHLQIKKAYKKAAVAWHPDKLPDKDDTMFKKVNRAWEVLGHPKTKLYYDSSLPFDDSIPEYNEKSDENDPEYTVFFKTFQEAFDRWTTLATAAKHSIPKLGNINSSKKHVEQFYFFWNISFKSWRDYGYMSEYDLTNADSREERRWMERQNAKMNNEKKKDEKEQIKKLVAECKKFDVRVKKFAQEDAEQREQIRLQKEQEKRQRELERIMKSQEEERERERVKKEKEDEIKRARAEEQRKITEFKNLQNEFREICKQRATIVVGSTKSKDKNVIQGEDVEFVVLHVKDAAELNGVVTKFKEAEDDKFVGLFQKCVEALKKRGEKEKKEREELAKQTQQKQQEKKQETEKEWTPDEIIMLQKAIVKFPGGTIDRWKRVAEFIGTRTADEVQKMTADVKKGKVEAQKLKIQKTKDIQATDNKDEVAPVEWTKEEQKKFEEGLRKHKNLKGDDKWKAIADDLQNRTPQECALRFDYCREMAKKKAAAAKK